MDGEERRRRQDWCGLFFFYYYSLFKSQSELVFFFLLLKKERKEQKKVSVCHLQHLFFFLPVPPAPPPPATAAVIIIEWKVHTAHLSHTTGHWATSWATIRTLFLGWSMLPRLSLFSSFHFISSIGHRRRRRPYGIRSENEWMNEWIHQCCWCTAKWYVRQ